MNERPRVVFHLARERDWQTAQDRGLYTGSVEDRADGFLHFSTAAQIVESAWRHRRGATDLVLLQVDAEALGDALRWEPSRDGEPFPHLYGDLPLGAVLAATSLPLGEDGKHVFPWI